MKRISRRDLYLNLSSTIKKKRAVAWCMRFLWLDIDDMSPKELIDLVTEYEECVAYPIEIPYYFFGAQGIYFEDLPMLSKLPTPSAEEIEVRNIFKGFQIKAKQRFNELKDMKYLKDNGFTESNKLTFSLSLSRNREFNFWPEDVHDFEYSFLWHLGKFLNGYTFNEKMNICPICGHYFAIIKKHSNKECCSPICSVRLNNKKIYAKNPALARKRGNLESYYSGLKKHNYSDARNQSVLRNYIQQRNYTPEEIPKYIKDFLNIKFDN